MRYPLMIAIVKQKSTFLKSENNIYNELIIQTVDHFKQAQNDDWEHRN